MSKRELTEQDKQVVLKVASLIESGSEGMEQVIGRYFSVDDELRQTRTGCCAMGAVYRGLGFYTYDSLIITDVFDKLGIVSWPRIAYPQPTNPISDPVPFCSDGETAPLIDVIIYLNDICKWSFDQIIAYLRDATLPQATITPLKP